MSRVLGSVDDPRYFAAVRNGVRRAGLVASALGLAAACGGTTIESGTKSSSGPIPIGQFPDALAHAFCDNFGSCCAQANVPFDHAACLKNTTQAGQSLVMVPSVRQYDPVAGRACVTDVTNSGMHCGSGVGPDHLCDWDVEIGTVPPGGACVDGGECAPPATCAGTPSVCVTTPAAGLGDPCVGSCEGADGSTVGDCTFTTGVTSGSFCFADQNLACGPSGTCEAIPDPDGTQAVGDTCAGFSPCEHGLYCDSSGHCANKKFPFSACQTDDECIEGGCSNGKCSFVLASECSGQSEQTND